MSTLKLIQKYANAPTTETLTVQNITEREKQHIIRLLSASFDFVVKDEQDYTLKIENILKADVDTIIDMINSI